MPKDIFRVMIKACLTYPLRRIKIRKHRKHIASVVDIRDKQKAVYELLCYLIGEFDNNRLLLSEQRRDLLPRVVLLFQIGAINKFHQLLERLDHLRDAFQYKFLKVIDCFTNYDYIGMNSWLISVRKESEQLTEKQNLQILTNLLHVNVNQYNEVATTPILSELENLILVKGIFLYEGWDNLMQEYECRGERDKEVKFVDFIERYQCENWRDFLAKNDVLFRHYQRTRNIDKQQEVLGNVIKRENEFIQSEEEKRLFEIQLLRLLFESRIGECEQYSVGLFNNRQRYLSFNPMVAFAFTEQFMAIYKDSLSVYSREMVFNFFENVVHDILLYLKPLVYDIDSKLISIPDVFLYQKKQLLLRKITYIRIENIIGNIDSYILYRRIYAIQQQILSLCKLNEDNREYLHWLLCFADDNIQLLFDNNTGKETKEGIREDIKKVVNILKCLIEKYNYSPNVAYYMLHLANIYHNLGETEEARKMLFNYDNTGDNYRVYNLVVQDIYMKLELIYQPQPKNPDIQLAKLNYELRRKNVAHEIKEALIIVNDKLKEFNLDGKTLPKDVTLGVLLNFVCTCGNIYLNGDKLDMVIEMADLFNEYLKGYDVYPSIRIEMGVIHANAVIRKGLHTQALTLLKELERIATNPDDLFKIKLIEGEAQKDFYAKVKSFSEALGLAERIGNKRSIAMVYQHLAQTMSIPFPALELSLLRNAECYLLECKDMFAVHENQFMIAQACALYGYRDKLLSKADADLFKEESRCVLKNINYNSLERDSERADYNYIYGLAYDEVNKLWEAYDTFKSLGGLSRAAKIAETIANFCSERGNIGEAIKGERAHLEVAKEMGNQKMIDYANKAIKYLGHRLILGFPDGTSVTDHPTLLHILNQISLEEEVLHLHNKQNSPNTKYFNPLDDGKCIPISNKDGTFSLYPFCRNPFHYYRGQSKRFVPCKPSLYRNRMTPSKQYLERVRYAEFHLLIDTHPICEKYVNSSRLFLSSQDKDYKFRIYHHALAQHYGIATELIDLTADKWVAAFFAATDYEGGEYKVHTDTTEQGVFYICDEPTIKNIDLSSEDFDPVIKPIGIQPFSRPGEQRGYAYPMKPEEDFEKNVQEKILFYHIPLINELIFNFANRSKRLFPDDVLKEKADIIKGSHTFSEAAYAKARQMFYPNITQDVFNEWEDAEGMHHQQDTIVAFTQKEMDDYHKSFPVFMEKLSKNIIKISD